MDRLQHARHGLPPGPGNPSQHVAVEMHREAMVASPGEQLLERTEHPRALVAGDEPHAGEPASLEPGEELAPGLRGLGVPLGAADDLLVAGGVDADDEQHGHVLVGHSPAALEVDAVDEDVGVAALERPLPPGLDGRLTWSIRAISDLERPAASIDRISFTVSRGTVISSILPGRARQSNCPGKPYGEGRASGPRGAALLLKLLNFSCSRCLYPSDHSDHFLVNINTHLLGYPLHLPGAGAGRVHLGHGRHERAVDALVALEDVLGQEAARPELGDSQVERAHACLEAAVPVAVPAVGPIAAELVGLLVHDGVDNLLGEQPEQ